MLFDYFDTNKAVFMDCFIGKCSGLIYKVPPPPFGHLPLAGEEFLRHRGLGFGASPILPCKGEVPKGRRGYHTTNYEHLLR
ncbi:hypothetical protein D0T60_04360 [Bacteroides sp. 224]|nr:hypothetical protein [Bacteroides sp. 224]